MEVIHKYSLASLHYSSSSTRSNLKNRVHYSNLENGEGSTTKIRKQTYFKTGILHTVNYFQLPDCCIAYIVRSINSVVVLPISKNKNHVRFIIWCICSQKRKIALSDSLFKSWTFLVYYSRDIYCKIRIIFKGLAEATAPNGPVTSAFI